MTYIRVGLVTVCINFLGFVTDLGHKPVNTCKHLKIIIMELFAISLMVLTSVILIVSLVYITTTTRHKEKMALLEKGLDPKEYLNDRFLPNALRVGIGFLGAFIMDEFIWTTNENPAIYPGCILVFGGLAQVWFYKIYKKK